MIWTCPNCLETVDLSERMFPLVCVCGGVVGTDGRFFIPDTMPASQKYLEVNGEWKPMSQEMVAQVRAEQEQRTVDQGRKAWIAKHSYSGCDQSFLTHWESTIPNGNCGCPESYQAFKLEDPPDMSSPWGFFLWGLRMHNRVNRKLGKPEWSLWSSLKKWKRKQPSIKGLVAITSVSPLESHMQVQSECIQSWRDMGMEVISGNTMEEISLLRSQYDVEFVEVRPSKSFDRPCPRIYDLMQIGKRIGAPSLLINSDISMYGHQGLIVNAIEHGENIVGLRNNWYEEISDHKVEKWGIDAFLLYPDQISTFPDLDFAIGQTMWDYWVAYHLQTIKAKVRWVGEPFFFHKAHPVNWDKYSVRIGQSMVSQHYGSSVDWETWRRLLPFGEPMR